MRPTDLRGILQYLPRFRDKTFVLAIDRAAATHDHFATLLLKSRCSDELIARAR